MGAEIFIQGLRQQILVFAFFCYRKNRSVKIVDYALLYKKSKIEIGMCITQKSVIAFNLWALKLTTQMLHI